MPVMPGALWRGEQSPMVPMTSYDIFCIHTIVGFAPAHAAHFSTTADGDIIQSRDTRYRSAANLEGNHRVIASENEDHGPRFGGTPSLPEWVPLTPEQVAANAEIAKWLNATHGIPLSLCPDSRPGSRGLAYHRQGIDGNWLPGQFPGRVDGGEHWSTSDGKQCPTDIRIAQLPDILRLALGEEDEVSWTDKFQKWYPGDKDTTDQATAAAQLVQARGYAQEAYRNAKQANDRAVRIEAAIKALAGGLDASVQAAVKDALAESVIDVDISVRGAGE